MIYETFPQHVSRHRRGISTYSPFEMCAVASLLGGALGRMFGGSSNLTFDSKSMYMAYVLTISW